MNTKMAVLRQPTLKITKSWSFLVWLVPACAAIALGFYVRAYFSEHGSTFTIKFQDGDGLRVGDTQIEYRGVTIGRIKKVDLSHDQREVLVQVEIQEGQEAFAEAGAQFWVVRPEVNDFAITGLNTVFTGPYIEAKPGSGEKQHEFIGKPKAPVIFVPGLNFQVHAARAEHLQVHAPVYYRGIEVGEVRDVRLSPQGERVDAHVVVWARYSPLVKANSRFWSISALEVKGGIFSGLDFKLNSLRTLASGGMAFATPEKNMGPTAKPGTDFALEKEVQKEWLEWAPRIALPAHQAAEPEPKQLLPTGEDLLNKPPKRAG